MKLFLRLFFLGLLLSLFFGIYYKSQIDFESGERIIGFTVLTTSLIYLPLFLYHRWNGKRLQDYTLSEENLKKMRETMNSSKRLRKQKNTSKN